MLAAVLINSCKTEVDMVAPYKEMAVIYGLLDISQPIQYIKINKAFLGVGNANEMAQIPDSVNFNPDDMTVTLEKYNGANFVSAITLFDTIIPGAAAGKFSKQNNIIYATRQPIEKDYSYKLIVKNNKTGYTAESSTNVINNIALPPGGTVYSFVGTDNKYSTTTVDWTSSQYAKIYELTFRFHYKEFLNGNDTVFKYIDWVFTPQYTPTADGGVQVKKTIRGEDFFSFLQSVKSIYFKDNNVKRIPWRGQLMLTAAGENFQIYKDLNAPYSSNFQEKPIYTNIKNGLGIFDSRITTFGVEKPFGDRTLNEFVKGQYTNDLGFIRL